LVSFVAGKTEISVRGVFVDANGSLAELFEAQNKAVDPPVRINRDADITPDHMPALLDGAEIVIIDHTPLPTDVARRCTGLKHVVFLGTGARSYMNPEELAELGIAVHLIKGYGDTAVAECAIALMWSAARGIAAMDREMRASNWLRENGMQLTGKTLGLIGFGGIAAEVARIALGSGMRVIAWNRSPKTYPGVEFVGVETLLAQSHVVSLHLLLNDETRGFLSRERIAAMKPGVLLVNTARGALVDEAALIEALKSGHIRHAGLDVFNVEPLPKDHPLTKLPNVTLSAHSAFRTPEANENLIGAAWEHCRRIARET
jgi:D-3-phosphoglycerate dehydrogenase / 2-oxoglutarate reductase